MTRSRTASPRTSHPVIGSDRTAPVQARTRLMGLLGEDIRHADLAFSFNNRLLSLWGSEYLYLPYPVAGEQLEDAIRGIRGLGLLSCNVTFPFKVPVIRYLDRLDERTSLMGSVNLVVNRQGELWGYNTDSQGFMDALQATGLRGQIDTALIYGAGGAGRAITTALGLGGVHRIWVYDIIPARCQEVVARLNYDGFRVAAVTRQDLCKLRPNLVVNATPLGRGEEANLSPLEHDCIGQSAVLFFDLNYNPARSQFLRQAENLGVATENGLRMMCYQAKRSIEIATGRDIPLFWFYDAVRSEGLEQSLVIPWPGEWGPEG